MLKMRIKEAAHGRPLSFLNPNGAVLTFETAATVTKTLHNRHTRPEIVVLSPRVPAIGASTD
jgi:hypothetical protein